MNTESRRFQYARSTAPDVLAAMDDRQTRYEEWQERVLAWGQKHGADNVATFNGWGTRRIRGLSHKHAPEDWTRPGRDGVRRPKRGTAAYDEMDALTLRETSIPGLAELYESRERSKIAPGSRFVLHGVAWFGLPWPPDYDLGPQWDEVLASQYHAALAARRTTPPPF